MIKRAIKGWIKRSLYRALKPVLQEILTESAVHSGSLYQRKNIDEIGAVNTAIQTLLAMKYRELQRDKRALPSFDDVQFRAFSQTGEDGLLLYVFSLIGTTNKQCVEICAGNGIECNTANLIINHGWRGLLFDGNEKNVKLGKAFYAKSKDTFAWPPKFVQAWITAESVNDLIRQNGFSGPVDLFSLDIDGNDYWVWKAVDCIEPRVVILEYQNAWGADRSVTQRYQADFVWRPARTGLPECGASLPAFVKLGREKGYRLVGCNRLCFNAIFVRDGIGEDVLPEVPVEQCLQHSLPQYRIQFRRECERTKPLNGKWLDV